MADFDRARLRARIYLRSVLPLLKVVMEEKPLYKRLCRGANGVVQIRVLGEDVGAALVFVDGALSVAQGIHEAPDVTIGFKTLAEMNEFLAGKPVIPRISGGLGHPLLVVRTVALLLALKILMPNALPKDPVGQAYKVRLVLYMITNGLSQLNKGGYPDFVDLVKKSPERVVQWTVVENNTAAYLRMKGGRTKSGRGTYERRRPFVHMVFPTIDGAFKVLTAQVALVEAVRLGYVQTIGPPEFGGQIGTFMQKIEELLVHG